ncbi:SRPBCC family protein [Amycolatopsis sp. H20-H5]|uniref:SRPBCC family protein n=1 Tax=Amycolatopsis sp. H20-H5 TaxID=3046309 RepID=UPI002DB5EC71|nr:SRPBCC family protein [Amycolatopsis sp. H20-H5]MEC3980651.1 SRPBCC family protein [Amycolatopsis sp. H20-H5]
MPGPSATGRIVVEASPEKVYALVSDPGSLAGLAEEYAGYRWLGDAKAAAVGARFRGSNRRGLRRWSTVSTVTDAEVGRRFGFEVTFVGLPVARWQYDIEPDGVGSAVTESTWDRRARWLKVPTALGTGVWQRDETNHENIAATLHRLKDAVERV